MLGLPLSFRALTPVIPSLSRNLFKKNTKKCKKNLQVSKLFVPLQSLNKRKCDQRDKIPTRKHLGELAEWSNAAVLKTVDLNGSGGSNPSLSANKNKKWRRIHSNAIFRFYLQRPASGGEGCTRPVSKSRRVRDCTIDMPDVRGQ